MHPRRGARERPQPLQRAAERVRVRVPLRVRQQHREADRACAAGRVYDFSNKSVISLDV
jgi:hypothetical protein